MGRFARGPQDAISAKSTCASSSVWKLVKFSRNPIVANCINDREAAELGLSWKVGSRPLLIIRTKSTTSLLKAVSAQPFAELSCQKSINCCHGGSAPRSSACQRSTAHTAPPDVPLMLTISNSSAMPASQSAFSAPAVNAV